MDNYEKNDLSIQNTIVGQISYNRYNDAEKLAIEYKNIVTKEIEKNKLAR